MLARCRPFPLFLGAWLAGLAAGCTLGPDGGGMAAPDGTRVFVFYPSGNTVAAEGVLVRGRGLAGAMPEEATHVQVRSLPTGFSATHPVAPDGSFGFELVAVSGDVLEIRGAISERLEGLGQPLFLRVPSRRVDVPRWLCCPETNICIDEDRYESPNFEGCPAPQPGLLSCEEDADCGINEDEWLELDHEQIVVSAPDENGISTVQGFTAPNMLVRLANVGKSAVGATLPPDQRRQRGLLDPGVRLTALSDDEGRFFFPRVPAIADDELIFQLEDLNAYKSPAVAKLVPDPPVAGVDVLEVFAWKPLENGQRGTIAVRIAPYGTNGRGICPNAVAPRDGLELCMGGGLEHGMVSVLELTNGSDDDEPFDAVPTATIASLPHNRGIEGNVRSRPIDLVLVVDWSDGAAGDDVIDAVLPALRSYVGNLRARDRVGIVVADENPRSLLGLTLDRAAADSTIRQLAGLPRAGENRILQGVRLAAASLDGASSGRIVAITFGAPAGSREAARDELDRVLDLVVRRPLDAFEGIPVDVVGVPLPDRVVDNRTVLEDLAAFSLGKLDSAPPSSQLEQVLANLRGEQVGSFVLLWDVTVPKSVGKEWELELRVAVDLPTGSAETTYSGSLSISNAE